MWVRECRRLRRSGNLVLTGTVCLEIQRIQITDPPGITSINSSFWRAGPHSWRGATDELLALAAGARVREQRRHQPHTCGSARPRASTARPSARPRRCVSVNRLGDVGGHIAPPEWIEEGKTTEAARERVPGPGAARRWGSQGHPQRATSYQSRCRPAEASVVEEHQYRRSGAPTPHSPARHEPCRARHAVTASDAHRLPCSA